MSRTDERSFVCARGWANSDGATELTVNCSQEHELIVNNLLCSRRLCYVMLCYIICDTVLRYVRLHSDALRDAALRDVTSI